MKSYLCVGDYSSVPYVIQGLEIRVYCMEELCYALKENAFLLDASLMGDGLVKWIREYCGLDELADSLHPMVHRKGSLSAFVGEILRYVGLYEEETVRQVEQVLKKGAGLSSLEKRKEQVDYLTKKKKYMAAIRGYDSLLLSWEELRNTAGETMTEGLKADVYHNKGVAYSRLMQYRQAAECFLQAYRVGGNQEEYLCFLGAKRLELPEKQYIAFASGEMEHYDLTLELEKKMEEIHRDFQLHPEKQMLDQRQLLRESGNRQRYYEDSDNLCKALKNAYRVGVGD